MKHMAPVQGRANPAPNILEDLSTRYGVCVAYYGILGKKKTGRKARVGKSGTSHKFGAWLDRPASVSYLFFV